MSHSREQDLSASDESAQFLSRLAQRRELVHVACVFGNAFRILILKYGFKDFALLANIVRDVEVTGEA